MKKTKQKNIGWKILLGLLFASMLIMLGRFGYEWWIQRRAKFIRYDAFGIEIPSNYAIHGIDVSKYQDIIDWGSVKSMDVEGIRLGFAFIKAT